MTVCSLHIFPDEPLVGGSEQSRQLIDSPLLSYTVSFI